MDTCHRNQCGHIKEAHDHYHGGTNCVLCECPQYRSLSRRGRCLVAAFGFSLAAAVLTGYAMVLLGTGYAGPGLVWLALAAMGLVGAGSAIARRGDRDGL